AQGAIARDEASEAGPGATGDQSQRKAAGNGGNRALTVGELEGGGRLEYRDVARTDRSIRVIDDAGHRDTLDVADNHMAAAAQPPKRGRVDAPGQGLAIDRQLGNRQ